MIDLHLHILPGVDDGAASIEDALQMAGALLAAGVHTVAATPHFADWTERLLPDRDAITRRVEELCALFAARGVGLTVVPGGECFLSPELAEKVRAGIAPTYGKGRYLLMELPVEQRVVHADRAVSDMHRDGVTIVLAHAERYGFVRKSLDGLEPLLSCGIAVQVSLGSLDPRAPSSMRRAAEALLGQGLVHVLATDAHHVMGVQDAMAMLGRAGELVGANNLALLTEENPRRVLAGEPLLACQPVLTVADAPPTRRWWPFRR
jgi:protein-tyrosine phosphatase